MARKIKVRLIMELREQGLSRRAISSTRRMSLSSVCEVFNIAEERGLSWAGVSALSEDEAYALFYPDKYSQASPFAEPDWDQVHRELGRKGVTLTLLHREYLEANAEGELPSMGYTRFCERYAGHVAAKGLTGHVEHKAGERCEVDWAGTKLACLYDEESGERVDAHLFVGVLPYSQYGYAEATTDMRQRSWLRCHVHMYEAFGGVPARTVCDNLKCAAAHLRFNGE